MNVQFFIIYLIHKRKLIEVEPLKMDKQSNISRVFFFFMLLIGISSISASNRFYRNNMDIKLDLAIFLVVCVCGLRIDVFSCCQIHCISLSTGVMNRETNTKIHSECRSSSTIGMLKSKAMSRISFNVTVTCNRNGEKKTNRHNIKIIENDRRKSNSNKILGVLFI